MNLTEARKVIWLAPHRPLGELLDEGFADRTRLEWASKNANNPRVQQAALVLLAWLNTKPDATIRSSKAVRSREKPAPRFGPMTLGQARATIWPLSPFHGEQMGDLVDTRRISLHDLSQVVQSASEPFFREAASLLMAEILKRDLRQPKPRNGSLRVIAGKRTFAERKQLQLSLFQGVILGGGFVLAASLAVTFFYQHSSIPNPRPIQEVLTSPAGWIALAIVLVSAVGLPWLAGKIIDIPLNSLDRQIENFRKGQEGENRAVDQMRLALDGEWTLFRNVVLPGRRGDIDAVLVGPAGVWALEVKTLSGSHRNIGALWEYKGENKWIKDKSDPSRQAKKKAIRLADFLKADGIHQWVKCAVIWANPDSPLKVENPMVAVWQLPRLADELANLLQGNKISQEDVARMIDKLSRLVTSAGTAH